MVLLKPIIRKLQNKNMKTNIIILRECYAGNFVAMDVEDWGGGFVGKLLKDKQFEEE